MGKRTQKGFRALSLPNLEFQSRVDWHMALRIMAYVALLYQDLIRTGRVGATEKLPPVLPIVLYNGERRWTAPQEVADLIVAAPGGLEKYRPRLHYLLLDEGHYREAELEPLGNLVAALFQLEGSRDAGDVGRVLEALIDWLKEPEQTGLRRAFAVWFRRVFLKARVPGTELPELQDLQEVRAMLAERVIEWTKQWKEEGLREGRQEGRQEGIQEGIQRGEALLLKRQLSRRHGRFVQVMDPATGRRWSTCRRFLEELYVHLFPVPAAASGGRMSRAMIYHPFRG